MTATDPSGAVSGSSASRAPSKRSRRTKPQVPDRPGVARIIAIANQKGGVGKSTTAVSLGAALADLGYRVLVLDLDPQGNASTGMGIRHEARDVTVYDVVVAEAPIDEAVVATPVPRLDAVPSTIDLAGAEIELVSQFSRESRLKRALEPVREGRYDFVLLDCPPSLGLLTVNALTAAEELIVPIQCEYYALEGLGQLLRNVSLVQQNINPGLRLSGIVMTMFDPRTKLSEQVVAEVRRFFGDLVYDVIIPRTVRLSEAPGFGQPITLYDPRSKGAEAYRELAREVAVRPAPVAAIPSMDELPTVVMPPPDPAGSQQETVDEADDEVEALEVPTVHQVEERAEAPAPPSATPPEPPEPAPSASAAPVATARAAAARARAGSTPATRSAATPVPTPPATPAPAQPAPAPVERPPARLAPETRPDDVWDEVEDDPEPRVRPVGRRPSEGTTPRRVVVIDDAGERGDGSDDAPTGADTGTAGAGIGTTLRDDDTEGGKRRWRLFRKGGED